MSEKPSREIDLHDGAISNFQKKNKKEKKRNKIIKIGKLKIIKIVYVCSNFKMDDDTQPNMDWCISMG